MAGVSDGRQAVEAAVRLRPNVAIMDINMPELNGIEATRHLLKELPEIKVMALSMHADQRFVTEVLEVGARGYLLKDCAFDELVRAVRTVVAGHTYLSPSIADIVVSDLIHQGAASTVSTAPKLTPREREVLQLLAEGKSTKQIAALCHVSSKTVETHRHHIMEKLNLEEELRPLMKEYDVSAPAQVLKKIWTDLYPKMVANPALLKRNQWPHTIDLLRTVSNTCSTAVVTGSPRSAVLHVLHSLEINGMVDLIISSEDVTKGKPDPESYLLAAQKLQVSPEECLVLEDSVHGVRAAVAAGMDVVAIATPFTNAGLHSSEIIEDARIVHEPEKLAETVQKLVADYNHTVQRG